MKKIFTLILILFAITSYSQYAFQVTEYNFLTNGKFGTYLVDSTIKDNFLYPDENNFISIKSTHGEKMSIVLFDGSGKTLKHEFECKNLNHFFDINTSLLKNGVYVTKILINDTILYNCFIANTKDKPTLIPRYNSHEEYLAETKRDKNEEIKVIKISIPNPLDVEYEEIIVKSDVITKENRRKVKVKSRMRNSKQLNF